VKRMVRLALVAFLLGGLAFAYWKLAIPTHRVTVRSELVMLGDLDGDNRWSAEDAKALASLVQDPSSAPAEAVWRVDVNQNGLVDDEDLDVIRALVASGGDAYGAEDAARGEGRPFPRPRELYRYVTVEEYRPRPLWAVSYPLEESAVVAWLADVRPEGGTCAYASALDAAIRSEAIRFDRAFRRREPGLEHVERTYAERKVARAKSLFEAGERYELLLALTELVEDAETLTTKGPSKASLGLLAFRDHLREVRRSPLYAEFEAGKKDWRAVLGRVSRDLEEDLGLSCNFESLAPPRNMADLESYLHRAEWQYYKSSTREADFQALVGYAQHDPRYLRAVSRTSRKLQDPDVENHNLPMVLLFREALRIKGGDKKKAVGLLDESIRIPYAWIRSIPRQALPGSLALDNFLLPGNKEDGADKSRHWNVFGGICLYKSPREALELALKREMQDLRDGRYSEEAMREFLRDMIANLNGMYHVMTVDPDLLAVEPAGQTRTGRAALAARPSK